MSPKINLKIDKETESFKQLHELREFFEKWSYKKTLDKVLEFAYNKLIK